MKYDFKFERAQFSWCHGSVGRAFFSANCFSFNDALKERYNSSHIEELEGEADRGDAEANYLLGFSYFSGEKGVRKDLGKALSYFEYAYDHGVREAGLYSGLMYFNGYGVGRDFQKGISMLTSAAEEGSLKAQTTLAKIYYFADDNPELKDYECAAHWFLKAAQQGDGLSMVSISSMYSDGVGITKNDDEAFYWILKAVDEEAAFSFSKAGDFYAEGIGTDKDLVRAYMMYDLGGTASSGKKAELAEQMTQAQIDEAVSLSRQWQEEHNSYRPSYHGLEAQGSDGHYEYH